MTIYQLAEIGESGIGCLGLVKLDGPMSKQVKCRVESVWVTLGPDGSPVVIAKVVDMQGKTWEADGRLVTVPHLF